MAETGLTPRLASEVSPPGPPAGFPGDGDTFPAPSLDIDGIEGRIERSLVRKVQKLIADHPDRALEVIRAWLWEQPLH